MDVVFIIPNILVNNNKNQQRTENYKQCPTMSLKYPYVIAVYKIKIKLQFVALGEGGGELLKSRPHQSEINHQAPYYGSASLAR